MRYLGAKQCFLSGGDAIEDISTHFGIKKDIHFVKEMDILSFMVDYSFCIQVKMIIPNLPIRKTTEPKSGTKRLIFIPAAITD